MSALTIVAHPGAGSMAALAPRDAALDPAVRPAFAPSAATDRLFLPGACVVTTGQQPGLFGGPAFVLHKALAAAALAEALEARWGRPVVPVFWCAGDDHDHAEASGAAWWAGEELVEAHLPSRAPQAPQHPMTREPLPGVELQLLRSQFANDVAGQVGADLAREWITRHWKDGVTHGAAFRDAMAELLAPLGVAVLDPTHPAFKRAQVPVLEAALRRSALLDARLAALPDAGTGITAGDGATLVFVEASAGRDRLVRDAEGFHARRGGERWSEDALLTLLASEPERFSANVLLRPVVEAALLPTVAYVAGPGEYRYLTAQASALYEPMATPRQVPVPRWGGTVVDAVAMRLLERLGLDADAVLADDGHLARAVLRRDLDPAFLDALGHLRHAIDAAGTSARASGRAIDAVLPRAVEHRQRRLHAVADDLEHLLERHLKKRDDIALAQYRRLRARLRPADGPQERRIGVAGMLAQFGAAWPEAVRSAAGTWARRVVAEVGG